MKVEPERAAILAAKLIQCIQSVEQNEYIIMTALSIAHASVEQAIRTNAVRDSLLDRCTDTDNMQ